VEGTYVHGVFASDAFRGAYLARLGVSGEVILRERAIEQALDDIAAVLERHLDIDRLLTIAGCQIHHRTSESTATSTNSPTLAKT
jgi:adenosylcobyric acid synthase